MEVGQSPGPMIVDVNDTSTGPLIAEATEYAERLATELLKDSSQSSDQQSNILTEKSSEKQSNTLTEKKSGVLSPFDYSHDYSQDSLYEPIDEAKLVSPNKEDEKEIAQEFAATHGKYPNRLSVLLLRLKFSGRSAGSFQLAAPWEKAPATARLRREENAQRTRADV